MKQGWKKCRTCGEAKPIISRFTSHGRSAAGTQLFKPDCNDCRAAIAKKARDTAKIWRDERNAVEAAPPEKARKPEKTLVGISMTDKGGITLQTETDFLDLDAAIFRQIIQFAATLPTSYFITGKPVP